MVLSVFLVSFALTALGFAIAWPMDSTQAFHGIINLFLIPLWLLSGALFPLAGASGWIRVLMRLNPLTYGVEALRGLLYPGSPAIRFPVSSLATLLLFSLVMFGLAFRDGQSPHHEACGMTAFPHSTRSSRDRCDAEWHQRGAAADRT